MIFIKLFSKLIKILKSGDSPSQIAWGFALGSIPGLTPLFCLHNAAVLFLLLVLNVNFGAALLALAVFSLFAWLLDPMFHAVGYWALAQIPALQPLWTSLYNAPVAPLTRFNNTVVMGSFLVSLVLLLPVFFLFRALVLKYRNSWDDKIEKWKIVKAVKASKFYDLYMKVKGLEG
ncbi:TIGR03546 family protein [bacterium]|nr:TIGR03546 family protein [bacterium]